MDVEQFNSSSPVFKDSQVGQRFLSFVKEDQDVEVEEEEVWDWMRTPPLQTIARNKILH